MKFEGLKAKADSILRKAGREASKPLHARAKQIIASLKALGLPITGVCMGMGSWVLEGDDYIVNEEGVEPYTQEMHELKYLSAKSYALPVGWTKGMHDFHAPITK